MSSQSRRVLRRRRTRRTLRIRRPRRTARAVQDYCEQHAVAPGCFSSNAIRRRGTSLLNAQTAHIRIHHPSFRVCFELAGAAVTDQDQSSFLSTANNTQRWESKQWNPCKPCYTRSLQLIRIYGRDQHRYQLASHRLPLPSTSGYEPGVLEPRGSVGTTA